MRLVLLFRDVLIYALLFGIFGFAFWEIYLTTKANRALRKIACQEDLKAMLDRFGGQYGMRDEEEDDQVRRA